jgi:hypothetical protein
MVANIKVYLLGGNKFSYDVESDTKEGLGFKVREHMAAIMHKGVRTNVEGEFVWYGKHWIDKIKSSVEIPETYKAKIETT